MLIIQGLAVALQINIHIIESTENFAEATLTEVTHMVESPRSMYLGHIGDLIMSLYLKVVLIRLRVLLNLFKLILKESPMST